MTADNRGTILKSIADRMVSRMEKAMKTDAKFRIKVAEATEQARLVAWDTCHKIYIAMDDDEARWYMDNKWTVFAGSPDDMLDHVCQWYEKSCGLEFIDATSWDNERGGTDFHSVIPQGYPLQED